MIRLSIDAMGHLRWHPNPGRVDSADNLDRADRTEDEAGAAGLRVGAADDPASGVPVVPVRAFPLSAPDDGISLVGPDGRERAWIDRLEHLPVPQRDWVAAELAARDFAPVIRRIRSVSGFAMPSIWDVETDRGDHRLVIKAEEAFRRLPSGELLISDSHGIGYRMPDMAALDPQSRRWLDRFL